MTDYINIKGIPKKQRPSDLPTLLMFDDEIYNIEETETDLNYKYNEENKNITE